MTIQSSRLLSALFERSCRWPALARLGWPRQLAIDGSRVCVASGEGGLHVLHERPEVLPCRVVLPWVGTR